MECGSICKVVKEVAYVYPPTFKYMIGDDVELEELLSSGGGREEEDRGTGCVLELLLLFDEYTWVGDEWRSLEGDCEGVLSDESTDSIRPSI